MIEREKMGMERGSYFVKENAILLWICDVIDYFIASLGLYI